MSYRIAKLHPERCSTSCSRLKRGERVMGSKAEVGHSSCREREPRGSSSPSSTLVVTSLLPTTAMFTPHELVSDQLALQLLSYGLTFHGLTVTTPTGLTRDVFIGPQDPTRHHLLHGRRFINQSVGIALRRQPACLRSPRAPHPFLSLGTGRSLRQSIAQWAC